MTDEQTTQTNGMVGVLLRDARTRRGEDIETVARELNIRRVYLEALEAGSMQKLPGQAYAVGFVRSYAEYLDLDPEELVERLKAEVGNDEAKSELFFPAPTSDSGIPGGAVILISMLLAVIVYGAWYYASNLSDEASSPVPDVPIKLAESLGVNTTASERPDKGRQPAAVTGEKPTEEARASAVSSPDRDDGAKAPVPPVATGRDDAADRLRSSPPSADAVSNEPTTKIVVETDASKRATAKTETAQPVPGGDRTARNTAPPRVVATVPASAPVTAPTVSGVGFRSGGGPAPAERSDAELTTGADERSALRSRAPQPSVRRAGPSGIVVRARADSWIQIRSGAESGFAMARMLRAGEHFDVPNHPGLMLTTGNAGAIEIVVNGTVAPALGPAGAVLRDFVLDPERLLAGTATGR